MQVVDAKFVKAKKVLLKYDIDVALGKGTGDPLRQRSEASRVQVIENFKLRAGIPTLKLCLQNAQSVIMMGHVGRPDGKVVENLKVAPIVEWFKNHNLRSHISGGKLVVLENLRFDPREESLDEGFAKELASIGDVFINEAFAAYRPAVSTTILPKLLPHAAGLRFAEEVRVLREVRDNPKKPFVAIMGGAKVKDKLPVITVLARSADAVLVGGKLVHEIREQGVELPKNVMVGKLNEDGFDIAEETTQSWAGLINKAAMIVWNGPLGKFEDPKYNQSGKIARLVLNSGAEIVVGGGDTVALLGSLGLLGKYEERGFVSVGGGAMLKLLSDGILPTIEALE